MLTGFIISCLQMEELNFVHFGNNLYVSLINVLYEISLFCLKNTTIYNSTLKIVHRIRVGVVLSISEGSQITLQNFKPCII